MIWSYTDCFCVCLKKDQLTRGMSRPEQPAPLAYYLHACLWQSYRTKSHKKGFFGMAKGKGREMLGNRYGSVDAGRQTGIHELL